MRKGGQTSTLVKKSDAMMLCMNVFLRVSFECPGTVSGMRPNEWPISQKMKEYAGSEV